MLKRFGCCVVSKLACIIKVKRDGRTKIRLAIDFRRSGVNGRVRASERVVLPRIAEVLSYGVWLLSNAEHGEDVELMVRDFRDAFHTLPIAECEKAYQVFQSGDDSFDVATRSCLGESTVRWFEGVRHRF